MKIIGWTPTQRARRQKLVVQNRRFLPLSKRAEHPNLASCILGAAVRELPGLWFEGLGYEPLLAETFTDIEAYKVFYNLLRKIDIKAFTEAITADSDKAIKMVMRTF